MKEKIIGSIGGLIFIIIVIRGITGIIDDAVEYMTKRNNQNEYIQQLEQLLLEQTQEKEVYMKMLEEAND